MAKQIINDRLIARKIGIYQPFTVSYLAEVSEATEAGAYAWMVRRTEKQSEVYITPRWIYKNKTYMMLIPRYAEIYGLLTVKAIVSNNGGLILS